MPNFLQVSILAALLCGSATALAQNEFGRFYTTPGQRGHLDELRDRRPQDQIDIDISQEEVIETAPEEVLIIIDSITVNGLVHRSDGKNTAWINRGSTNQGNIETQYTRVGEKDVRRDNVRVTLPDKQTSIELKVGQEYDVHNRRVIDMVDDGQDAGDIIVPGGRSRSR